MSQNTNPLDENLMQNHEYDGIQELDNDLPNWWVMLFIVTIIFSIIYMAYYHVLDIGLSQTEAYEQEVKENSTSVATSGKMMYSINCMACHGKDGQGISSIKAPQIAGQEQWYLEQQISNFRHDIRGYHSGDVAGSTMRNIAKSVLKSESDVKQISEYVASLKPQQLASSIHGDVSNGQLKYAMCSACHGPSADGNKALKAPRLKGLNDWYIVDQLKSFKAGRRGSHEKDTAGKTMAPMALALSEKDMADIATFIISLNKQGD